MIDWIKAFKSIDCDFQNEGQGGTGNYIDEKFGEVSFHWHANFSKIEVTWFDSEPICICGHGMDDWRCDCDWDWFLETEPKEKTISKKKFQDLKSKYQIKLKL